MRCFFIFVCTLFVIGVTHAESLVCDAGYYYDVLTCKQCPAGTYSPGGDITECIQCPKNTYNANTGATECTPCPDEYPNSDAGATANTQCYSNEKERPWTGHQVCTAPGCVDATCEPCVIKPCKYVAYCSATFPWETECSGETVKSGCETNNANCSTPVTAGVAKPGWGTVGTQRCEKCPAGTYGPGGENAECIQCPTNKKTSPAGSISQNDCGRILNYQKPGDALPTQIYLNGIRNTSPSFNVKIGDDILYANMTAVTDTTIPGMYVNYDNQTYIVTSSDVTPKPAATFTITTTSDTTAFKFKLSAMGNFMVDWGDGTIDNIVRDDVTATEYSHTYATAGSYKIGFDGVATGYSSTNAAIDIVVGKYSFSPKYTQYIQKISGSLGAIFQTINGGGTGNQPLFISTFSGATNLTGEIPAELFTGIGGTPAQNMFKGTFENCSGLTGLSPRMSDGTPLYTWAASIENACRATTAPFNTAPCATFTGATGLSDYDEIPDAFK